MEYKVCPKCTANHSKPGVYCSRVCANARSWSDETNLKRSVTSRLTYANKTEEEIKAHVLASQTKRTYNTLHKDFDSLPYDAKRKRVLLEQNCKCSECQNDSWMGKRLRLELDHIDGNHSNNERSNLRGLCPNCHSQTPTWRGKTTEIKWKEIERLLEYKHNAGVA